MYHWQNFLFAFLLMAKSNNLNIRNSFSEDWVRRDEPLRRFGVFNVSKRSRSQSKTHPFQQSMRLSWLLGKLGIKMDSSDANSKEMSFVFLRQLVSPKHSWTCNRTLVTMDGHSCFGCWKQT